MELNPALVAFSHDITNVFCATGEGGGVDPSCPAGQGSREVSDSQASTIHSMLEGKGSTPKEIVEATGLSMGAVMRHLGARTGQGKPVRFKPDDNGGFRYSLKPSGLAKVSKSKQEKPIVPKETRSSIQTKVSSRDATLIQKEFGLSGEQVARLTGAQDGSKVTIKHAETPGENFVHVSVKGQGYMAERHVYKDYIENERIEVYETGKGLGTKVFHDQVQEAARSGFKYIETYASRGESDIPGYAQKGMNGHYTWARLGYDAKIPRSVSESIREKFPEAERISDLMKTPEGRQWWKDNGVSFQGKFDLAEGSLSRRVLDAYIKTKAR